MGQRENKSTVNEEAARASTEPDLAMRNSEALRALYEMTSDANMSLPAEYKFSLKWLWLLLLALSVLLILYLEMPDERFATGVISIAITIIAVLWLGPKLQIAHLKKLKPEERFQQENEARKTLAQIIGGVIVLGGLYYTGENIKIAQKSADNTQEATAETIELTRQGQITERFTKAVEQLGKEDISIRLGGIYALERIAKESKEDHWPIMELLTAYLRNKTKIDRKAKGGTTFTYQKADIQAILTVIGRRKVEFETDDERLDLQFCDLSNSNLYKANLYGAILIGANLSGSILTGAHFTDADLSNVNFQGTDLGGADFKGAVFYNNTFVDATLTGADFTGSTGLKCQQLNRVGIEDAKLPPELGGCRPER
jgi:hypothetical protein